MRRVEDVVGDIAAALVDFSHRRPLPTLGLGLLLTLGSLWLAATRLSVDTDSNRLLSSQLPVRRTNVALDEAFPALQDNLVVMIEADDPADARDAALELRARLAEHPDRYPGIFLPGYGPYYDDFGLYYLDRADLDELARRVHEAGPFLAALAERPELPTLLGGLSHIVASPDGIDSLGDDGRRILEQLTRSVRSFDAGKSAPIAWKDLLFEDLGAEYADPQLLFVQPAGDLTRIGPVQTALRDIRSLAGGLEPRPGLRVRLTGDRAAHTEEMSLIIHEVLLAGSASLLLVTGVLFTCLRSGRLLLATLVTLLAGLAWTAGLAAVAVGRLNALTSAFAVLYIGLGVDFGIHFALGYLDERGRGAGVPAALHATGSSVGSSLFLCAFTTAIGFYAFIPTDYTAVAEMGIISGTGIFLGLLATLSVYPALIGVGLGESPRTLEALARRPPVRLPRFPLRHPRLVCGIALLLAVFAAGAARFVQFDFSTLKVRDPRVESVQALADLVEDPEISVWTIDVIARDLAEADAVADQLGRLDGVEKARTARDFLPEDQAARLAIFREMRGDLETPVELTGEERGEGLDRAKAVEYTIEGFGVALDIDADLRGDGGGDAVVAAAEALREELDVLNSGLRSGELPPARLGTLEADLFGDLPEVLADVRDAIPTRQVGLDDLPRDLLERYVAADGRARVEVLSASDLNRRGELERFSDVVHAVRPDAGGPAAGTVALGRATISALRQALATAVVVIALVLVLVWRSFKYALIALAPLAFGSVTTAAVSVLADIPFNFANVIVLPLILGIGVDSGIHLVHRHRMGLQGRRSLLATSTARAILFSALTTVLSFGTLAFAHHLGIASLAQMLCVGVLLMLASNLILLPAILTWVDGAWDPERLPAGARSSTAGRPGTSLSG